MPRSEILDASVGPMFTKYALNALAIDFLSFRILPLRRNSDENFEHFDLLITCFFQVIFTCQNQRLIIFFSSVFMRVFNLFLYSLYKVLL